MEPRQPGRLEQVADIDHPAGAGAAQARHNFIAGNELPQRWQGKDRFVILETGFGPGLNFLTTWQAWRDDPQRCRRLHFVAVEKHPLPPPDLATAQQAWPEFAALAAELQRAWPPLTPGIHRLFLAERRVVLTLLFGEAASQLRTVDAAVDAFFLDGSLSAGNPELCKALARLAAPGATLATGAPTGDLPEALRAAEFEVTERPGLTGQPPLLTARFRSQRPNRHRPPDDRRAIVIGAGIAGSSSAYALAAAGWQVTVLERAEAPATGASSNLAGVLRPLPSADDNRLSRLTRAGYLATRALLQALPEARWSPCGVLHLGREPIHEAQQRRTVDKLGLPPEVLQFVDRDAASTMLGWPVETGGWWFPEGGWVQPPALCGAALAAFPERITVRYGAAVDRLVAAKTPPSVISTPTASQERRASPTALWQAQAADGSLLAEAPLVVIAGGADATRLAPLSWLPQRSARGQVSHLPAAATPPLPHVVCKLGYAMPEVDGLRLIGATLQTGDDDCSLRAADHRENLARLNLSLPGFAAGVDAETLAGRVGFRPMSPDRLPIVGPLPDLAALPTNPRLASLPRIPGLWCMQGFGARGIVWSALMADLLVSRIEGEPLPLENDLVEACDPGRFLLKGNRRQTAADDDTT